MARQGNAEVQTQIRVHRCSSVVKIPRISPFPVRHHQKQQVPFLPGNAPALWRVCGCKKACRPPPPRAGWVGCNFALNRMPVEARIPVVTESRISPATEVREKFKRVKPLKEIGVKERGWTLDVLNIVRRVVESRRRGDESLTGKPERLLTSSPTGKLTPAEAYASTRESEVLADGHHSSRQLQ